MDTANAESNSRIYFGCALILNDFILYILLLFCCTGYCYVTVNFDVTI